MGYSMREEICVIEKSGKTDKKEKSFQFILLILSVDGN